MASLAADWTSSIKSGNAVRRALRAADAALAGFKWREIGSVVAALDSPRNRPRCAAVRAGAFRAQCALAFAGPGKVGLRRRRTRSIRRGRSARARPSRARCLRKPSARPPPESGGDSCRRRKVEGVARARAGELLTRPRPTFTSRLAQRGVSKHLNRAVAARSFPRRQAGRLFAHFGEHGGTESRADRGAASERRDH